MGYLSILYVQQVIKCLISPGPPCDGRVCPQCRRLRFDPRVRKIPWRRKWQPTPALLPGKSHGWRRLAGYSPWGCKELDMTEQLHILNLSNKYIRFWDFQR